jgi:HK97 family phage major capsid protein
MPNTVQLREQRANIWSQMREVMDRAEAENRPLSVDERSTYDAAEADLDRIGNEIELQERHEARTREFSAVNRNEVARPGSNSGPAHTDVTYDKVFTKYLKGGMGRLTSDEQGVLAAGYAEIQNALAVGTNSAGGYLVPPGWRDEFIVQMKAFGNVQAVAQVIETDSGQPLQWPTMNDTANVGRLLAENTQMTETDIVVGTATLGAYMYSSDLTRVSLQLVNDAAFDVDKLVQAAHAERLGRITNQHFTTGTGTAQPQGIVTGATSGVTAAGVAAITADEIIDLVHSVDPAYRTSARAQFMTTDTALKSIRKLKDTTNQYLWQPGLQAGVASTLYGYPVVINQDMAVPATGVKSVLFGDFYAGYVIRIVQGIQTITFTERYLDYLQVGHSSYMRADGKTQNASAYKALTQA